MKKLIMRTLGTIDIELNGRSCAPSLSRKAQALLVYLACQTYPTARELLITLLWPDSSVKQSLTNLRKMVSELRRLLPDHLLVTRQTIGLALSDLWLDVAELNRCLPDEPATAVALYSGPFLPNLLLSDCPDFMAWVASQREQYHHLIISGLHRLTDDCLRRRRYSEGVVYAQQLVSLEPLSETASRALMLLLARSGQAQAALDEYRRCCQQLAVELGVVPMERTQSLSARIATAVHHPPSLPFDTTQFVGREAEISQINQVLSDPNSRWLTITGPGGVGKTRLALQIAHEWAYDFLHGVHFVSLTAVNSPDTFMATLASSFNLTLTGNESPTQQISNYLRQKELLLLLDDADTLLAPGLEKAADLLPGLLNEAAQIRLLMTARERFNYRTEQTLPLAGLPLTEEGAPRLFLARAAQVWPDFTTTAVDLAAIHQICQLVEGLPLALELAAAGIKTYTPTQIAAAITQTLDFLHRSPDGQQNDDRQEQHGRHSSLRVVFERAWQQLTPVEQTAVAHLSLFPASFTAAAATAVAAAPPSLLLTLVDKSMLWLAGDRYQQHAALRAFAAEKVEDATTVYTQFGHYYAAFLQEQEQRLGGSEQQQALQLIEAEIDNIRAAWAWLVAAGHTQAVEQAMAGLHRFFDVRGRFVEGQESFRLAVTQWEKQTDEADTAPLLARLLARQGFFEERLSRLETAVATLQRALVLAQKHKCLDDEAFILNQLGLAVYNQGAYDEAERHYRLSLAISRRTDNHYQKAATLVNLGVLLREQGAYSKARTLFEESLSLLRRSGNQRQLAIVLQTLGSLAEAEGAYIEARAQFRQSLAICEQFDDRMGRAIVCANLANIARRQGDLPDALSWGQQAVTLFTDIGDPWGVAVSSVRLGEVMLALADYSQARQLFQTSLMLCREMGDQRGTAVSLCNLGYTALALQLNPQAQKLFDEAIQVAEAIQFIPWLLKSKLGLAQVLTQSDESELAVSLAAFVAQHPAADEETRTQATAILTP